MIGFDRQGLNSDGFQGFVPLRALPAGCAEILSSPGVYVVVRATLDAPRFVPSSLGGRFKGRDPAVSVEKLMEKWVANSSVLYIGRASQLRRRIDQFARFGRGEPIGHWGGRYLWQLEEADDLEVAWKIAPEFKALELELIEAFIKAAGALPFANLNQPRSV